jgi:hypothetical protein
MTAGTSIVPNPTTLAAGFEAHLHERLVACPSLAVSLPWQNRPWSVLAQRALSAEEGITVVVAPHAASFADVAAILNPLAAVSGLSWMQLGADTSPAETRRLLDRLTPGLGHTLVLVDALTLQSPAVHTALIQCSVAHMALWQPQYLPMPPVAHWLKACQRLPQFTASYWLPALPLDRFIQSAHATSQALSLEKPAWVVVPPLFDLTSVSVVRKITGQLKRNKLLRLLRRDHPAQSPAMQAPNQVVVVGQPQAVAPMAQWLEDRLTRPVLAFNTTSPTRQQHSLLNTFSAGKNGLLVMPVQWLDGVVPNPQRPVQWLVWEPIAYDTLIALALSASERHHSASRCLVFHTKDDVADRRAVLQHQQAQGHSGAKTELDILTDWHDWILGEPCRKTEVMRHYRHTGGHTLPVWLPQWDEHPPAPCGDCDRCHAAASPRATLPVWLRWVKPLINRLLY